MSPGLKQVPLPLILVHLRGRQVSSNLRTAAIRPRLTLQDAFTASGGPGQQETQ